MAKGPYSWPLKPPVWWVTAKQWIIPSLPKMIIYSRRKWHRRAYEPVALALPVFFTSLANSVVPLKWAKCRESLGISAHLPACSTGWKPSRLGGGVWLWMCLTHELMLASYVHSKPFLSVWLRAQCNLVLLLFNFSFILALLDVCCLFMCLFWYSESFPNRQHLSVVQALFISYQQHHSIIGPLYSVSIPQEWDQNTAAYAEEKRLTPATLRKQKNKKQRGWKMVSVTNTMPDPQFLTKPLCPNWTNSGCNQTYSTLSWE